MDQLSGPVLVATDLSESSVEALQQGGRRAQAMGTRLLIVHVVHLASPIHPVFPHLSARDTEQEIELARQVSDRLSELAREHSGLDDEQVDVDVDFSDVPYASIVSKAEETKARLVVVGHRGQTGLRRMLLGSVAERVVRAAHCPVLIARPHSARGKMLVASDLSDPALTALEYACHEHRRLGLELVLMHNVEVPGGFLSGLGALGPVPYQPSEETLEEVRQAADRLLSDQLERFGVSGETHVTAESRTDEIILRMAEEHDVELIVVGSHGRSGVARIAVGSVAHSVLQHAHCSVMAVHVR